MRLRLVAYHRVVSDFTRLSSSLAVTNGLAYFAEASLVTTVQLKSYHMTAKYIFHSTLGKCYKEFYGGYLQPQ